MAAGHRTGATQRREQRTLGGGQGNDHTIRETPMAHTGHPSSGWGATAPVCGLIARAVCAAARMGQPCGHTDAPARSFLSRVRYAMGRPLAAHFISWRVFVLLRLRLLIGRPQRRGHVSVSRVKACSRMRSSSSLIFAHPGLRPAISRG